MSETKWTPGPWRIKYGTNVMATTPYVHERTVAACGGFSSNTGDMDYVAENEANARLISHAPTMADFIAESVEVLSYLSGCVADSRAEPRAEEALAKARTILARIRGEKTETT